MQSHCTWVSGSLANNMLLAPDGSCLWWWSQTAYSGRRRLAAGSWTWRTVPHQSPRHSLGRWKGAQQLSSKPAKVAIGPLCLGKVSWPSNPDLQCKSLAVVGLPHMHMSLQQSELHQRMSFAQGASVIGHDSKQSTSFPQRSPLADVMLPAGRSRSQYALEELASPTGGRGATVSY